MAGYDYCKGMSNNAVEAYARGLKTKSKIRKKDLIENGIDISLEFAIWLIENKHWEPREWHHCSKKYNTVYFYDFDDLKDVLDDEYIDWSDLKEKFTQESARISEERRVQGEFDVFGGTNQRPRFIESVPFTGVLKKGWIITNCGKKKKANGNYIRWKYMDEQKAG